jgi:diamine N-acetyltransferase
MILSVYVVKTSNRDSTREVQNSIGFLYLVIYFRITMSGNISIRMGGPNDIPVIEKLAWEIWPETYARILSPEQLKYMMNLFYSQSALRAQIVEKKHSFLLVEEDEKPVGFASYSFADEPGVFKLHKIYVLPGQQGKGLGKMIIDRVIQNIRLDSAVALQLNVNRHNKARNFYEKFGFKVIKEEDIDIGNNYFMNDYVMEMKLS